MPDTRHAVSAWRGGLPAPPVPAPEPRKPKADPSPAPELEPERKRASRSAVRVTSVPKRRSLVGTGAGARTRAGVVTASPAWAKGPVRAPGRRGRDAWSCALAVLSRHAAPFSEAGRRRGPSAVPGGSEQAWLGRLSAFEHHCTSKACLRRLAGASGSSPRARPRASRRCATVSRWSAPRVRSPRNALSWIASGPERLAFPVLDQCGTVRRCTMDAAGCSASSTTPRGCRRW